MPTMVVVTPAADLRREPNNRSERMSQVLFGHTVVSSEEQEGFIRVTSEDNYRGWINAHYLVEAPSAHPDHMVASRFSYFKISDSKETLVLPFGALLKADESGEKFAYRDKRFLQPFDGTIEPIDAPSPLDPAGLALTLTGSPYLWGGTSPFGYDCSGLVQAVFRRCGVILPRDSKDQSQSGKEIAREEARRNDLFFFPGHVAIHLGEQKIVHATRMRGIVVVESLRPGDPKYREDIAGKITTIRRVMA